MPRLPLVGALALHCDTHVELLHQFLMYLGKGLRLCCSQANEALEAAIAAVLLERGQKVLAPLVAKVLQLWQTLQVRFGICVLGPAASGKSTVIRTLQVGNWIAGQEGHRHLHVAGRNTCCVHVAFA